MQKVGVMVGYVTKPKAIRDGQAATCILKMSSAKQLSQKKSNTPHLQSAKPNSSQDTTVNNTDAAGQSARANEAGASKEQ